MCSSKIYVHDNFAASPTPTTATAGAHKYTHTHALPRPSKWRNTWMALIFRLRQTFFRYIPPYSIYMGVRWPATTACCTQATGCGSSNSTSNCNSIYMYAYVFVGI